MSIRYKIDVLEALKNKGLNTNQIREKKLLSQSTLQQLRHNNLVSWLNIDRLCTYLDCQPGDLLEYVPDEAQEGNVQNETE